MFLPIGQSLIDYFFSLNLVLISCLIANFLGAAKFLDVLNIWCLVFSDPTTRCENFPNFSLTLSSPAVPKLHEGGCPLLIPNERLCLRPACPAIVPFTLGRRLAPCAYRLIPFTSWLRPSAFDAPPPPGISGRQAPPTAQGHWLFIICCAWCNDTGREKRQYWTQNNE